MTDILFPGDNWLHGTLEEAKINSNKLDEARRWLANHSHIIDSRYRILIVRGGKLVAEWNRGVEREAQLPMSSASKSIFSSILGIALAEGKIGSIDDPIVDYYPEAMDVPDGTGPKPGRYAFEKDRDITFRQLISNTSGYMKPDEKPGEIFHYQTYGMNIITHAIAKTYGFYDSDAPDALPGFKQLIDDKLRIPLGAKWDYKTKNFPLPQHARINIFGNYTDILATTHDMARLGWLWCNWGRWGDTQLIPEKWLREAVQTASTIRANSARENWNYGHGFWTNDFRQLLPSLPEDSFVASGAGGVALIWVCPSLKMVVAHNPGLFLDKPQVQLNQVEGFLKRIVEACD